MPHIDAIKLFEHCRLIVGMVLSLALARLLNGLAKFVQHPKKVRIYPIHLGWVFVILLFVIHFWWWEFKLYTVQWTFEAYLLVISYAINFFLMCSILFPDQMDEYDGYEDYFKSRHSWFFGLFALSFFIDFFDTLLKGADHYNSLGIEYTVRNIVFIILSIVAMFNNNRYFHNIFVVVALVYEAVFIFRAFHTQ